MQQVLCCILQFYNIYIIINILSSFTEPKFNFDYPRRPFIVVQLYLKQTSKTKDSVIDYK